MEYQTYDQQDAVNFADEMADRGIYCEVMKEGDLFIVKEVK